MTNQPHADLIERIAALPDEIARLIAPLTPNQLTARPLAGEWSVAQNVHHLADSHMNSYIRCKLVATEDQPLFKAYKQDVWAELPDAKRADVADSLAILRNLHARWVIFWQTLPDDAWERSGMHPERGVLTLADLLHIYADHGAAHVDQITRTIAALPDR